ncbi:pantetheine-phosphate adenylyltransferase [Alicyclobacillus sp. SO9]|uniref:pantetheine-phosphate adenylyltransferase n=1 Tax=Alicyclobacillus sp. SO9 TaxID=2665646 RepID=UPI0018E8F8CF|nr:pantetheine-phosphate adenylyltransferase [Alicyclobacillus sp. SO9]QQE80755.1 pantetheine-phosphate adenylyltransferase [Alicyclobacillus sp. SO9]
MRIAIYPGSFDPITYGHLDIVKRAAKLFDKVIVAVLNNLDKKPVFTTHERIDLIGDAVSQIDGVSADSFDGLLVDYVRSKGADAVIRGLRGISDFESEFRMAQMNRKLDEGIITVFLPSDAGNSYVSSSLIKQIAAYGGDLSEFVPVQVAAALRDKFRGH